MSKEIDAWMKMYEFSPSLVLFDDMVTTDYADQDATISKTIEGYRESLNPIDVVLESLVNKISEKISSEILTSSKDKVLITLEIRQKAIEKILRFIKKDPQERLELLHQRWLSALIAFMKDIYKNSRDLKRDEVLFQVSRKFRISGTSTTRAISAAIGLS